MNDLIKVTPDGKVTSRELYEFLQLEPGNYARWCKSNIVDNQFAEENIDWGILFTNEEYSGRGQKATEYWLMITFAKKLCMLSKSERGEQARNYFIEVERRLQEIIEQKIPQSFAEALRLAADQAEQIERQTKELAAAAPKVEFYDTVTQSATQFDMQDVAGILNVKGLGRTNLFRFLVEQKVLIDTSTPYRVHIEAGRFKIVESSWTNPKTEEVFVTKKVVVSQKGLDYIRQLIKDNHNHPKKIAARKK